MNNLSIDDINLFLNSYNKNLLNGTCNAKMPQYVAFLNAIKMNVEYNIPIDGYTYKNYGIENDDINKIHKLINRVKKGKPLHHRSVNQTVSNNLSDVSNNIYSNVDGMDLYQNAPTLELTSKLKGAMNSYHTKMNDLKQKRNDEINKKRYTNLNYNNISNYNNFNTDYSNFVNTTEILNNKQPLINEFDKINNILNYNEYSTILNHNNTDPYQRMIPNIMNDKNKYTNIPQTRFIQDSIQYGGFGNTRNSAIPNKQPFENQFQYLDFNYNQVLNDRLIGTSSRLDNRENIFRK